MSEAKASFSNEEYNKEYKKTFPQPELDEKCTKGRLQDKVAIVTGGNSGIGRAIVERLSSDGAIVAIFARNEERSNAVVSEVNARGGRASFYKVDVCHRQRLVEAVKEVADANNGVIDILVNNAKFFGNKYGENFMDLTAESFDQSLSYNVVNCAVLSQACFPYLKKGENSSIVNITSVVAKKAVSDYARYCTLDSSLMMMTKCMALDMSKKSKVRVNCVSPGMVWTPGAKDMLQSIEVCSGAVSGLHMTGQVIQAAGVASAVAFLCSKDAMFITGTDLPVDLGNTAMGPEGLGQPME